MSDSPNPFVKRWLGNEKSFEDAINTATGTTAEQRQQQFKESFDRASAIFNTEGFIKSHPILLEARSGKILISDSTISEDISTKINAVKSNRQTRNRRPKNGRK